MTDEDELGDIRLMLMLKLSFTLADQIKEMKQLEDNKKTEQEKKEKQLGLIGKSG